MELFRKPHRKSLEVTHVPRTLFDGGCLKRTGEPFRVLGTDMDTFEDCGFSG